MDDLRTLTKKLAHLEDKAKRIDQKIVAGGDAKRLAILMAKVPVVAEKLAATKAALAKLKESAKV